MSLSKKAIVLTAFPILLQVAFLIRYAQLVEDVERLAKQEYLSKAVINHGNWSVLLLSVATNSVFGFALTGNKDFYKLYKYCIDAIPSTIAETYSYSPLDNKQLKAIETLNAASKNASRELAESVSRLERLPSDRLQALEPLATPSSMAIWKDVYKARHDLLANGKNDQPNNPQALPAARKSLKDFLNTCLAADLILAVFLIYAFNEQIARKLEILSDNARRLGRGLALAPAIDGNDEIALFDAVFHQTADQLAVARSQLEESEARIKQIIENMPIGLITLDEFGALETLNKEGTKIVGANSDPLTNKALSKVLPALRQVNDGSASEDEKRYELETERDGSPVVLEVSKIEYPTRLGNLTLVAMQDITSRRELEQMRQDFLNMVSHDLRSPLTSVQIFHGLLAKGRYGELNKDGEENLEHVKNTVQRLVDMITKLLDFEKLDSRQVDLTLAPVAVQSIINDSINSLTAFAKAFEVTINAPNTELCVLGDQPRLTQVMVNLLSNALKFSPEGETVSLKSEAVGDFVEVSVIDKGRGVAFEDQKRIFEKFKQVRLSDATEKGGVGLGLPICKLLVEQQGGSIGVESAPGAGSRFWFRLPSADCNQEIL